MKLPTRFIQLPIRFDADALARELRGVRESDWIPHPAGYAGNDFLPLVSANGDPGDEAFEGPMRPTPFLSADRPYLRAVLANLGAVIGRTRLMRLSGRAEVNEHVDVNYYWRERMRVHVPIITQPTVSFHCGGESVHMAAGECWVFDTWSLHRVVNDQKEARIHLVTDTVGGEGMLRMLINGRSPNKPAPQSWAPIWIPPNASAPPLEFETVNVPAVMTPWELREHINFLLSETIPRQPIATDVARVAFAFLHRWRALWSAHGESQAAWPLYRALLNQFAADLRAVRADELVLVNEIDFYETISGMVLASALADRPRSKAGEVRQAPARQAAGS